VILRQHDSPDYKCRASLSSTIILQADEGKPVTASSCQGLACAAAAQGEHARHTTLWRYECDRGDDYPETIRAESIRRVRGASQLEYAWSAGSAMTVEDVYREVLPG
jgi:hypothetical protein